MKPITMTFPERLHEIIQVMPFKRDKQQNIIEGPFVRYSGGVAESPLLESFYRGFFEVMEERDREEGWKR